MSMKPPDEAQSADYPDRHHRQIGLAGERFDEPDNPLEERRFACPVGTDDCDQCARLDRAVEVVHRRMAVISEREVAESQRGAHRSHFHGPDDGAPYECDQPGGDGQPLDNRHAQDRRRNGGRRMTLAGTMVVMRVRKARGHRADDSIGTKTLHCNIRTRPVHGGWTPSC